MPTNVLEEEKESCCQDAAENNKLTKPMIILSR